jgi:hypothetical protein
MDLLWEYILVGGLEHEYFMVDEFVGISWDDHQPNME